MDGSEVVKAPRVPAKRAPGQIGVVTSVSGFKLSCMIFGPSTPDGTNSAYATAQIGALVKVPTLSSTAFGFIADLNFEYAGTDMQIAVADIDLLGELTGRAGDAKFIRGISIYPVLGAPIFNATADDIKVIYAKPNSWTLQIGSLHQDAETPAYLMSQEFLSKHSAIVGTTGSGKSCALTLILRTLLTAHPNGHVVMLDPHGEYATAFDDIAELDHARYDAAALLAAELRGDRRGAVQQRPDGTKPRSADPQRSHHGGEAGLPWSGRQRRDRSPSIRRRPIA